MIVVWGMLLWLVVALFLGVLVGKCVHHGGGSSAAPQAPADDLGIITRDQVIAMLPASIRNDFRCPHNEIQPFKISGDKIELARCLLCGEMLTNVGRTVTEHAWRTGERPSSVLPPALVEGANPLESYHHQLARELEARREIEEEHGFTVHQGMSADDFNARAARGEPGYGNHPYDF